MQTDPVSAMDDLLSRLGRALVGAASPEGEPTTGTSADGLVAATVGPDGHVRSIVAEPAVLRRPASELADAIMVAVNQAVDARPGESALSSPIAELKQLQQESAVRMRQMSELFTAAVKQLEASRR